MRLKLLCCCALLGCTDPSWPAGDYSYQASFTTYEHPAACPAPGFLYVWHTDSFSNSSTGTIHVPPRLRDNQVDGVSVLNNGQAFSGTLSVADGGWQLTARVH